MTEEKPAEKRIEIYRGLSGEVVFDIDTEEETIWATQEQIAQLFGVTRRNILMHLNNIYETRELDKNRTWKKNFQVRQEGKRQVRRELDFYNLDAIISVGYRVNSKKATNFRIWATSVLKGFVTDGVAVNERRLKMLAERREIKKLHDVEDMMGIVRRLTARNELGAGEANGVLEVISKYAGSFKTLQEYDDGHIDLKFLNKKRVGKELTAEMCESAVEQLRRNVRGGELFGKKRGEMFDGSLASIFQSFDGKELYPSVPEKGLIVSLVCKLLE